MASGQLLGRLNRRLLDDIALLRRISQKQQEIDWLQQSFEIGVAATCPVSVVVAFPRGGRMRVGIDGVSLECLQKVNTEKRGVGASFFMPATARRTLRARDVNGGGTGS